MKLELELSRRNLLAQRVTETVTLVAPALVLATCSPKESVPIPNLNLKIDERGWQEVINQRSIWEFLPDAQDKQNLNCIPWFKGICLGKISTNFKVVVNRPVASFLFKQAKLDNLPLPHNLFFVDHWETSLTEKGHEGGFTAITADGKEQHTILWLKYLAWHTFKQIDHDRLSPIEDHFTGLASYNLSVWTTHELGHAGAELKAFWGSRNRVSLQMYEAVHPQIYDFQNQYSKLFDQASKQGKAKESLIFGVQSTTELKSLRLSLYNEADKLGIKFINTELPR